jgi:hypothetical protein
MLACSRSLPPSLHPSLPPPPFLSLPISLLSRSLARSLARSLSFSLSLLSLSISLSSSSSSLALSSPQTSAAPSQQQPQSSSMRNDTVSQLSPPLSLGRFFFSDDGITAGDGGIAHVAVPRTFTGLSAPKAGMMGPTGAAALVLVLV